MNIYVSCLLIFLLLNNSSLSRVYAEETSTESTETVISETSTDTLVTEEIKTDTPLPETKIDTPLPENKTDIPAPEAKTDTPLPETKKDTPAPAIKTDSPAPETKTVRPTTEIKKEISTPNQPSMPTLTQEARGSSGQAPQPVAKPLKTGDVYMRQGHKEEFTQAVGIRTPVNTNTQKATSTPRTEDLKKLQQARVSSAKKTSIPSTTKK